MRRLAAALAFAALALGAGAAEVPALPASNALKAAWVQAAKDFRALAVTQQAEIAALKAQPPAGLPEYRLEIYRHNWQLSERVGARNDCVYLVHTVPATKTEWDAIEAPSDPPTAAMPLTIPATAYSAQSGTQPSGQAMGYFDPGDWLEFAVLCPPSSVFRTLSVSAASPAAGSSISVSIDGQPAGTITLPAAGSWTAFQSVLCPLPSLRAVGSSGPEAVISAGSHTIRLLGLTAAQPSGIADIHSITLAP